MQASTDSTEWHVTNGQRLAAIELQKVKIRELEREAEHCELNDPVRQRELQRLAAIELQSEKSLAAAEQRKVYIEGLQRQAEQPKLDAAAKRLKRRRAKDQVRAQQEAVCGDEKSRENKRLRNKAGIRAGGAYKRPLASQQATEPSAKKRLVGEEDRRSR